MKMWTLHLVFVFNVQEVSTSRVGQEVEQSKDSCTDVGAPPVVVRTRPGGKLDDEGDKVQGGGKARVDQFLEEREGGI